MAGQTTRITGLWSKDTSRGVVLSAALKPEAKAALLKALDTDDLLEVVVFVNDRRDKDSSPTHNLCIGAGRARTAQEPREAEPAPADAGTPVRGKAWRGEAGTSPKSADDEDSTPF